MKESGLDATGNEKQSKASKDRRDTHMAMSAGIIWLSYDRQISQSWHLVLEKSLIVNSKDTKKKTKLVSVGVKRDEETVFNVNVLLYFKTDLFLISHDIFISIKLYLVRPRIMLHLFVFLNTFLWVCSISYFGENVILSTHQ